MPYVIRLAALSWRNRPDFAFALLSTGSFARLWNGALAPHGLFALPAALHACERTCHFKHCSYVIFASNTDEIRGISIVEKYCSYMSLSLPANISLWFSEHWYMCKKYDNISLFNFYYMGIWFSTRIYRLTLVIKHWKNLFYLKDVANGTRNVFSFDFSMTPIGKRTGFSTRNHSRELYGTNIL